MLPYVVLGQDWKEIIVNSLRQGPEVVSHEKDKARLERALINLRKQHLWGDIIDEEYHQQKNELGRQLNGIMSADNVVRLPNLEQAAHLLADLPGLWEHPGVTEEQRESLIEEVFQEVRLLGSRLVSIKPKPDYQPLFAYIVTEGVRNGRGERI